MNSQIEIIFGYSREELLGHPVETLLPDVLPAGQADGRADYIAATKARIMGPGRNYSAGEKNGERVPVEIGLNPIPTPEGMFVLASIVDVTERKRVDQEMVRNRNELAHLSRVTMLGELSGSIAHELNQPLTSILSNAQAAQRLLSRDAASPGELREILNDIVAEDKRAGEIIRRLRALFTKGEVQRQPLSINDLVVDVVNLLHGDMVSRHVSLVMKLQPDLPKANGDKVQLQQVLHEPAGERE